jgi:DNA-binding transcriptional LysR family regulator
VRLTAAGAALLDAGRPALAAADAAFAAAREAGQGLTGTIRVGVSPAVSPLDRQEVVDVLRRGAPDVSVSLLEVRPRDVRRLLRARELDLVLARTSDDAHDVDSAALRPTCPPAGRRPTTSRRSRSPTTSRSHCSSCGRPARRRPRSAACARA